MTKLDELIQDFCPEGVEFLEIKECVISVKNIKWKDHTGEEYQYIDLTSVDRDTHSIIETQTINSANAPSRALQIVQVNDVLLGTTRPMLKRYCYITKRYDREICSTGFCVLRPNTRIILPGWLYHNISSSYFFTHVEKFQKGASYPAISDADVKAYRIPVPPLEVQREIVRILDNFTELTADLTAELTVRKKQYEYYRNELLFRNVNIPKMPIGVVCNPHYGKGNKIPQDGGEYPVYGCKGIVGKTNTFNSEDAPIVGHIGSAGSVTWGEGKHFVTYNGTICTPNKDLVLSRYLYHILVSMRLENRVKGNQPFLSTSDFSGIEIPIPPITAQERLVNLLDNFDAICSDLKIGLPAEIEARQKQYEYYRDMLLTFKEKTSEKEEQVQ